MAFQLLLAVPLVLTLLNPAVADGPYRPNPRYKKAVFEEVPIPNPSNYNRYLSFMHVNLGGEDLVMQFTPLLESGTFYPGFTNGTLFPFASTPAANGSLMTSAWGSAYDWVSMSDFDRTSIIQKHGKIWAVTHNEVNAGAMFVSELNQDRTTGILTVARMKVVPDTFRGLARPCSGSTSPWLTHLGGEESFMNARDFPNLRLTVNVNGRNASYSTSIASTQAVVQGLSSFREYNPYWSGWMLEVDILNAAGDLKADKRYSLGRIAWELSSVMPDNRTVYGTDDESGGGCLTMFVADRPGDLRSGKLYAAKWIQTSDAKGGKAKLRWIHLNPDGGSVHEDTVKAALAGPNFNSTIKFSDLFDFLEPTWNANGTKPDPPPAGYRAIQTEASIFYEWVRLKPGMGALASRLETRRMAAYMGATTEFSKFEGIAYDTRRKVVYFACTAVRGGMLNGTGVRGTFDIAANDIRLPSMPAGAVYRMKLLHSPTIGSSYVGYAIEAIETSFGYQLNGTVEYVPPTSIASPDNIGYSASMDTLFISEDCDDQHVNNLLWALDLRTMKKTRIHTSVKNGEVTGSYYFPNVGNFSYLFSTIQHPDLKYNNGTVGHWIFPRDS